MYFCVGGGHRNVLNNQQPITLTFVRDKASSHGNCNKCYLGSMWNTLHVFCLSENKAIASHKFYLIESYT